VTYDGYVADMRDMAVEAFHAVRVSLQKSANRNKKYYDLGLKQQQFATGDWVLYFNPRKLRGKQMKWVRQFEGPFLVVSRPTSLTAKVQRSPKAQIRVAHIDKLKPFTGTPPKAWKVPDEVAVSSDSSHRAMAGTISDGQGHFESPPEVAQGSNTDPYVVDGQFQLNTVEGSSPESVAISSQSAVRDAKQNAGSASPTFVCSSQSPCGHSDSVQPMGMAESGRSESGEFSAPMGARKFRGDLLLPRGATGSQEVECEVYAAEGQHYQNGECHATNRFASGLGWQAYGAVSPSDVVDRRGIETGLNRLGVHGAGANVVARGRLANEPSLHVESAALPSVSTVATQDADRSILDGKGAHDISVADRIADLQDDSMSGGNISSDCGTARGTAQCRATAGNVPDVEEQLYTVGDSSMRTGGERAVLDEHTASAVVDEGAATPSVVEFPNLPVPGLYLRNDRLITDRSQFGRHSDSVLVDANDANAQFDEFGYLYDVSDDDHTDNSNDSCENDEFGTFAQEQEVLPAKSPVVENAPECETRISSAGLPQDCINLESAVFDENSSQRPRRNLRRPANYDDFSVNFANSQYLRRIKMRKYSESDYSSTQAVDVLLTSCGLQTRPLIGQSASLAASPLMILILV